MSALTRNASESAREEEWDSELLRDAHAVVLGLAGVVEKVFELELGKGHGPGGTIGLKEGEGQESRGPHARRRVLGDSSMYI